MWYRVEYMLLTPVAIGTFGKLITYILYDIWRFRVHPYRFFFILNHYGQ